MPQVCAKVLPMLDYGLDMSAVERDIALPDLVAEGEELDALVSAQSDLSKPAPAAGWTIAHLAAADVNVPIAIRTPEAFDTVLKQAETAASRYADLEAAEGAAIGPAGTMAHRSH